MYDVELSFTRTNGAAGQAVTSSAASTNVIDLGTDKYFEKPLYLHVRVTDAVTADGAATVAIALQSDAAATFGSAATYDTVCAATGKATFVDGYHIVRPLQVQGLERYIRLYFTVATGPLTAGTFVAYLSDSTEL